MPFYDYVCKYCENVCEKFHGMKENRVGETCKACNQAGAMERLPSQVHISHASDIGKIVTEFIRENRELTQQEKEKLSKQEYKK